jgi:Ca2+-binding RTX toxin-like protein
MKAISSFVKCRSAVIAVAVLAIAAPAALAASLVGDGTIVGTAGQDFITAGNGNDTIWGLGGGDQIKAGMGNDMIDADGACPDGVQSGDYPNGLPSGDYCEHGQFPESATASITAGNGNDVVYGGGGPNNIKLGNGSDTVYGGLSTDNITVGGGTDTVENGIGADNIKTGAGGGGTIYANNGQRDLVTCAKPNSYTVYATTTAVVKGCAHVVITAVSRNAAAKNVSKHSKRRARKHTRKHARGPALPEHS